MLLLASALAAGGVYAYLVCGPGSEFLGTWELRAMESTGRSITLKEARKAAAQDRARRPAPPGTVFLRIWWDRTIAVGYRASPGDDTVWSPEARWWAADDELWVDSGTPLEGSEETTATIVNGELRVVERGSAEGQAIGSEGAPPEQLYAQQVTVWYRADE